MRRQSLLVSTLLLLGCGLSPRDYCTGVADTTCQRLFDCTSGAERDVLMTMYADVKACSTAVRARSQCDTQTEQTLCRSNHWNPTKAAACVEEVRTLSCDALSTYRPTCAPPCE